MPAFRRDGELARAARIALWLSREYALAFGNDAAAGGWLARAERLLERRRARRRAGWLDLARSERARDAQTSAATRRGGARRRAARGRRGSRAPCSRAARVRGGVARESGRRAGAPRRGDGSGDERRARDARDLCGRLLHPHARVRARRRRGAATTMESRARGVRAHGTTTSHCSRSAGRAAPTSSRPTAAIDAAEAELVGRHSRARRSGPALALHPSGGAPCRRSASSRADSTRRSSSRRDSRPIRRQLPARGRPASRPWRGGGGGRALLVQRLDELGWTNLLAAPLLAQLVDARLAERRWTLPERQPSRSTRSPSRPAAIGSAALATAARGRIALAAGDADAMRLAARSGERVRGSRTSSRRGPCTTRARARSRRPVAGRRGRYGPSGPHRARGAGRDARR